MPDSPTIVWFRRDLRLDDHPALAAAAKRGPVVPVYVHDPEQDQSAWAPGGASRWWLHASLESLSDKLAALGCPLTLRIGNPGRELGEIIRATGADRVMFNEAIEPASRQIDEHIDEQLGGSGSMVDRFGADLLWPIGSVMTQNCDPYQVFSPFWKMGLKTGDPEDPVPAPRSLRAPDRLPESARLDQLGLLPDVDWAGGLRERWTPGERGAVSAFAAFVRYRVDAYHDDRDRLDLPGWSAMSPHIHFGEISVRRIWQMLTKHPGWKKHKGREHYLREVGWREFAQHLLNHFPHTTDRPLREKFSRFPWREDPAGLRAWQRGLTGYPAIDAAMRQLYAEGWMPNRARMMVASFLCKNLMISWQHGAAWFWDTLVDANLGSNTLGWQWTAGCGADAAPYFRIFNPITQGEKFDPAGDYVRRWVPELAGLDQDFIHKPWQAPPMALQAAGVTLGETYPERVVDHPASRERALAALETITA
ncbi:MAG: deoxyribodipyrimidine photo-lyase [Planctomycetota bacterium]